MIEQLRECSGRMKRSVTLWAVMEDRLSKRCLQVV